VPFYPTLTSFAINQSTGALTSAPGSPINLPGNDSGDPQTFIVKIP